jgi:hypothetical protein
MAQFKVNQVSSSIGMRVACSPLSVASVLPRAWRHGLLSGATAGSAVSSVARDFVRFLGENSKKQHRKPTPQNE